MKTPPLSKPLRHLFLLLTGQMALLLMIGAAVSYQVRWVEHKISEMADLKDPSPFTASLMGTLNTVNLNLVGFVQNRDPLLKQALEAGEQEFESALEEFHQQNQRLLPNEARTRILGAYEPYKMSVHDTLTVSNEQAQKWEALLSNDDDMMFWLEHRLRPLVRHEQAEAADRLNVILNLESQLRSIPKDLTEYVLTRSASSPQQMTQNSDKFTLLLTQYQSITKLVTERKNLAVLNRLWNDNVVLAKDIVGQEKLKREAFGRMIQNQQKLHAVIKEVLPAVRPEVIEEKKRAIFHSITLILCLAGFLVIGGMGSLIVSGLWGYRRLHAPRASHKTPTETRAKAGASMPKLFHQALIGIGLDGNIVRWDMGAEQLYGYGAKEIEGQSMKILFQSGDEIHRLSEKLKEHKQAIFDTTHMRKDGTPVPVHVVFDRVTDPQGKLASLSLQAYERAA